MPRLKVNDNHRSLVTADGKPFFWLGDTAWELFHRLNREEATLYLEDRAKKGFTVIQAVALAEFDGLNTPNAYGHRALLNNDPTQPDVRRGRRNDYWDHVDFILNAAARRGLVVALVPTWGEWVTPRFVEQPVFKTTEQGYRYGNFLGNRWRGIRGLVWILGGDRQPTEKPHAMAVWRAMVEGIADGVNGNKNANDRRQRHAGAARHESADPDDRKWL